MALGRVWETPPDYFLEQILVASHCRSLYLTFVKISYDTRNARARLARCNPLKISGASTSADRDELLFRFGKRDGRYELEETFQLWFFKAFKREGPHEPEGRIPNSWWRVMS